MSITPRRLAVAVNPDSSPVRLAALAWHPIPWVAIAASHNSSCPRWARNAAILRRPKLARDLLQRHVDVPRRLLIRCAEKPRFSSAVVVSAVQHPNADEAVWRAAAQRPKFDLSVVSALLSIPDLPTELVDSAYRRLLKETSLNLSSEDGHYYADTQLYGILLNVCRHRNASADMLSSILNNVRDHETSVLDAIAGNPNTREEDAVVAVLRAGTGASRLSVN